MTELNTIALKSSPLFDCVCVWYPIAYVATVRVALIAVRQAGSVEWNRAGAWERLGLVRATHQQLLEANHRSA